MSRIYKIEYFDMDGSLKSRTYKRPKQAAVRAGGVLEAYLKMNNVWSDSMKLQINREQDIAQLDVGVGLYLCQIWAVSE